MSDAYYNENDPFAAQWLRNLIDAKLITKGDVDARSVVNVRPDDLKSYTRCHFFAGIAGWELALRLADFPADQEVWTGSCPCQPFSVAGKAGGFADERHLWPYWFHLIAQRRPATLFGEQVASKAGLAWFDLVWTDLEGAGYAVGVSDLGAACVGAPHIRQRLWFVAHALHAGRPEGRPIARNGSSAGCGAPRELAHPDGRDASAARLQRSGQQRFEPQDGRSLLVGDTNESRSQGRCIDLGEHVDQRVVGQASPWRDCDWLLCTDGKARPVESVAQQMVNGLSAAMGLLCSNEQFKKEVVDATQSTGFGQQVLRAMREGHGAIAIWQSVGRCYGFSEASLLLACLCEQKRELGYFFYGEASRSTQAGEIVLRKVQCRTSNTTCAPQGWQLSKQCLDQLADALSKVPQASALRVFNGFPLATGIPGRVGQLRAYGNAIVPQVAAAFVEVAMQYAP